MSYLPGGGGEGRKAPAHKPVINIKEVMTLWQRIKDEMQDTECCGETWEFLSEWRSPETGTAQHSLWSGCEKIVELCHKINGQINMAYPHPLPSDPKWKDLLDEYNRNLWSELQSCGISREVANGIFLNARITTLNKKSTLAKCEGCGAELIAPYDGHPYWCMACSHEHDEKRRRKSG